MFVDDVADFLQAAANVFGVFSDSSFQADSHAGCHPGRCFAASRRLGRLVDVRGNRSPGVAGLATSLDKVSQTISVVSMLSALVVSDSAKEYLDDGCEI